MIHWNLGCDAGYQIFRDITQKAERLNTTKSEIMRVALMEYLEHHPRENEAEERKLYYHDEA